MYISLTGIYVEHQRVCNMTSTKKSARNIFSLVLTVALICLMTAAIIPGVMGVSVAPVNLGSAGNFSILGKFAITNVPTSAITGDVGLSPATGASIGLTQAEVTGKIYTVDAAGPAGRVEDPVLLTAAVSAMQAAYDDAIGRPEATGTFLNVGAGTVNGVTLVPGLYTWTTPVSITGDITLDAEGNESAVWIFQCDQTLDLASGKQIILSNGANASNIYWAVTGATSLQTTSVFNGNLLDATNIALFTGARLNGRALSLNAGATSVALDANTVTIPTNSSVSHASPTVTGITPATGVNTTTIAITNLSGTGFLTGATVNLTRLGQPSIIATGITVVSPTKITCTFDLTGKIAGLYNVTVTNTDGNYGTYTNGFTVSSATAPVASFTGTPTSGTAPLAVQFTDLSSNTPTSWNWSFGDATYSTTQSPSKTYSAVGTYTVSLNATNAAGSNTFTRADYIVVSSVPPVPPAPVALFTGTPISGIVPLTVTFTDLSTNTPTSWLWRFGNDASGLQNPTYTYSAPGNYTVILTVNNAGGLGTLTRTNYISVYDIPVTPPVASFTGFPTSGPAPLSVWFNSTSTNVPTSRAWNFGDGSTVNLSVQNLTHVYLIPGTYTVNLTATNAGGSNTSTRIDYITVTGTPVSHPVASFAADPASGSAPLLVSFTDTSSFVSPLVSWAWNFGDGGTSTVQNPEHIYTSVGMYNVQLTVTDQTGLTNTTTETNAINAYSSVPVASFTYSPSTGPAPLSVTFTGTSSFNESIVSRLWQFGDGNSATGINPVHSYTTAGSYNVTYNVTDQNGAFSLCTHNNAITVTSSPPRSVDLGLASNYAILSKSGISTTGSTSVTGNMGVSPITATGITGFALSMDPSNQYSTSSLVVGRVYAADYAPPTPATLTTSISNMETAYVDAAGRAPDATELYAGNLGGKTLAPGVYKWSTGVLIPTSTTLTLDAQGNENAVWIFEVAQDLTMDSGSQIVLANSAKAENIYWQIGGGTGVTIEAGAHAEGNILALKAITMKDGASLNGRALAQTAVSLIANTVTIPTSTATTSTVGVYREGVYYLASANQNGGGTVNAFSFGTTNDKPVVVDNKVGVFRNGVFFLASANQNSGGTVNAFTFGTTNDVPVVVDNKVGVFRNGIFYLASTNQNGGGNVNAFSFGTTGDVPVVVDNKVGVFRNGMFYLASANQAGGGNVNAFTFGTTNDVPVVWHHDGIDTVGVFREGTFYLASANQNGGGNVNAFTFGTTNDKPVAGSWA
jgi:PKD repeat protein